MKPNLNIGDKKIIQLTVNREDTALNYGSGKLENLFASPKLLALMIEAASKLIDPKLETNYISVGKNSNIEHLAPTILGQTITLEVIISEYVYPKISLKMRAYDEIGLIGKGTHSRYIVDKLLLLENAYDRFDQNKDKN